MAEAFTNLPYNRKSSQPLVSMKPEANSVCREYQNSNTLAMIRALDEMKLSHPQPVFVRRKALRKIKMPILDNELAKQLQGLKFSDTDIKTGIKSAVSTRNSTTTENKWKLTGSKDASANSIPAGVPTLRKSIACWDGRRNVRGRRIGLAPLPKLVATERNRRARAKGCSSAGVDHEGKRGHRIARRHRHRSPTLTSPK